MVETQQKFECRICKSPFIYNLHRSRHEKMAHKAGGEKSTNCPVCGVVFTNGNVLTPHLRAVHGKAKGIHKCTLCQTPFNSAGDCLRHERTAHNEVDGKSVNCPECDIVFSNKNSYNNHRIHIHKKQKNPNIETFIEPIEGNSGTRASGTKTSLRGRSRFLCLLCRKTFARKENCVSHIVRDHAIVRQNLPCNPLEELISPNHATSLSEDLGESIPQNGKYFFDSIFEEPASHKNKKCRKEPK